MAEFEGLPLEVKQMTIDWLAIIAPECLSVVRYTSKGIKSLAEQHFAQQNFNKIILFNAENAMKQFAKMTAHPVIGPAIKTVILSALRVAPDGYGQWVERLPVIERHACETGIDIQDTLTKAFINLKAYGQSITIGITDEVDGECFGYKKKLEDEDEVDDRQMAADEVDAFDTITAAAHASKCGIKGIDVMLYTRVGCPRMERVWDYYDFPSTLRSYLNKHPDYDVHIETEIGRDTSMAANVVYNKESGLLSIKKSNSVKLFGTWRLSFWLTKVDVKELSISNNSSFYTPHLSELLVKNTDTIEIVDLTDLKLGDQDSWKSLLTLLSTLPKLKRFTLQNPSIKYKSRGNDFLRYILNNDISSTISLEGDVGAQLAQELASYEVFRQQKELNNPEVEDDEEQDEPDSEPSDDSDVETDDGTMETLEGGVHTSDEEEESESEEEEFEDEEDENEQGEEIDDKPKGDEAGYKAEDDEAGHKSEDDEAGHKSEDDEAGPKAGDDEVEDESEVELNKYGIVETGSDYEPDSSDNSGSEGD